MVTGLRAQTSHSLKTTNLYTETQGEHEIKESGDISAADHGFMESERGGGGGLDSVNVLNVP